MYRVTIEKITDGDVNEVVYNELLNRILLVGEDAENTSLCTEIIINNSIAGMAAMLLSGKKTRKAIFLANAMRSIMNDDRNDKEDELLEMIMGGMEDGTDS